MKTSISRSARVAATTALVLSWAQPLLAHTWVEQLNRIAPNGTFVNPPGFINGYKGRTGLANVDGEYTFLMPPNNRPDGKVIHPDDKMCKSTQAFGSNNAQFPVLTAAPGDWIAMRYQENGHVTLPQNQANKPLNRGTVYIYGTTELDNSVNYADVFGVWNADGTGGNGKGRLLATRNFDDGRCYQINPDRISQQRQQEFKKIDGGVQGDNLWCQSDLQLRDDLEVGKEYAIYWVWNWPTMTTAGAKTDQPTAGAKVKELEAYTSCMTLKIVDPCSPELGDVKSPSCAAGGGGGGGGGGAAGGKTTSNNSGGSKKVAQAFNKEQDVGNSASFEQITGEQFVVPVKQADNNNNNGGGGGSNNTPDVGSPTPTKGSGGGGGRGKGGKGNDHVKTVTVTQGVATVTVTAGANNNNNNGGGNRGGQQGAPASTPTPSTLSLSVTTPAASSPTPSTSSSTQQQQQQQQSTSPAVQTASTTPTSAASAGFPQPTTARAKPGPPTVSPFLRQRVRRVRRGAGEWRFGY
ncbi:uncharacterized protein E0L32_010123 [Thyridium curvatum]|uniref:DUF7492 domain-containing protein n=1 Tax=Thyridium curvatum TaxID=1093900 RepID=A0A507ALF9_9PEZI|nr:uncharacterized protein E0L32_010123 [Thyridium curvatum]TPX08393.1 hypothetical protein E0L32_010123 [Thyridium curvatum]